MGNNSARIREGGEVLDLIDLDRPCFATMLCGPDRRTLFMPTADWHGTEGIESVIKARTGQVLIAEAPAPGVGRPSVRPTSPGCACSFPTASNARSAPTMRALLRVLGVVAIVCGTIIVGFSPNRWDVVLETLPRGHGIHSTDIIGSVFVALGITALWFAPRRS